MKQSHKTLLLWILIATMFFAIWHILEPSTKPATEVAFSEFMTLVEAPKEQPHVEQVGIKGREYTFTVVDPTKNNAKEQRVTVGPDGANAEETTQAIKAADRGAAYLEATRLAGFSEAEARRLFGRDPGLPESTERDYLTPWTAARAEKQFLARFAGLHK